MGKDAVEIFEQTLPYDIYLKVFGYLSCKELCKIMTVCKASIMYMYMYMCVIASNMHNLSIGMVYHVYGRTAVV